MVPMRGGPWEVPNRLIPSAEPSLGAADEAGRSARRARARTESIPSEGRRPLAPTRCPPLQEQHLLPQIGTSHDSNALTYASSRRSPSRKLRTSGASSASVPPAHIAAGDRCRPRRGGPGAALPAAPGATRHGAGGASRPRARDPMPVDDEYPSSTSYLAASRCAVRGSASVRRDGPSGCRPSMLVTIGTSRGQRRRTFPWQRRSTWS